MSEVAPAAPAAPAPAAETVVDPNATAAPDVKTPEENKPERTFSQKELDEILEKRLAKERRKREELSRRLQVTEELALRGGTVRNLNLRSLKRMAPPSAKISQTTKPT
jgi:hypothetical protein